MENELKNFEIVDTHVHLIHPSKIDYEWKEMWPENHKEKLESLYLSDNKDLNIRAILFMEVSPCVNYLDEALLFEKFSEDKSSKIEGIIAHIPMDKDIAFIKDYINKIKHPKLIGFRYMIHIKDTDLKDPYYLHPDFYEKLQYLGEIKMPFHISAYQHQLSSIAEMAEKNFKTVFNIEDLGKPLIKGEEDDFSPWANGMKKLAALENVFFKLSPGFVYPNHIMEKAEPYVEYAIDIFGTDRLSVASDYGITNIKFIDWASFLLKIFHKKNLKKEQIENIFSNNSIRMFNLFN